MEEEKQIVRELIDKETGKIIEIYKGDSFRITRDSQKEAITKSKHTKEINEEIKDWNNELGGFVFVLFKYSDTILKQHPEITSEDITKLFYLSTYVDYNGYLIYDSSYMTKENMKLLLKLSRNIFNLFFSKMIKCEIFIKEDRYIKINKDYFTKGEIDTEIKQNYDYTRLYIKSIRYLFENVQPRKQKLLGNYFKLIPYIHRQRNILCWNPDSKKEDIILLRSKELQEILQVHRHTITAFINELVSVKLKNGESIVAFIKNDPDNSKLPVYVNPRVFYGGNFDLKNGKQDILENFQLLLK
jgi:hypothetical protein